MKNKTKILNLLGLAMCAGKLVIGGELTLKGICADRAKFVFVAQDASENTRKKIKDKDSCYNAPVSELFSQFKLSQTTRRPRMVIRVTDAGLTAKIKELLKGQEGDYMGKKRTYKPVKEMNKAGRDVVDKMHQLGMDIKSYMGAISSE